MLCAVKLLAQCAHVAEGLLICEPSGFGGSAHVGSPQSRRVCRKWLEARVDYGHRPHAPLLLLLS